MNELVFGEENRERKVLILHADGSIRISYQYRDGFRPDGEWREWQDMGASLTAEEVNAIVALKSAKDT